MQYQYNELMEHLEHLEEYKLKLVERRNTFTPKSGSARVREAVPAPTTVGIELSAKSVKLQQSRRTLQLLREEVNKLNNMKVRPS